MINDDFDDDGLLNHSDILNDDNDILNDDFDDDDITMSNTRILWIRQIF